MVCREYNYDLDKRGDSSYVLYVTSSLENAVNWAKSSDWLNETRLHIWHIPCDVELHVSDVEKYVIQTIELI